MVETSPQNSDLKIEILCDEAASVTCAGIVTKYILIKDISETTEMRPMDYKMETRTYLHSMKFQYSFASSN